ncbi:DUF317 domain-containing protein [Streptomyces sp. OfavH-34-F]|uniref:DUF317 domain-containing protein n=1 Tax=Streptomyces sp. OfavH-34-F TaxID=2917760 RepID=UPI0027E3FA21|nr:DUF317 domain-containing protein [Streptomyces sp. OfavH-34-F]
MLVSPRYLAGLGVSGEASFAPVAHWPRHDLGDSPCQLLVTSPDHRIRIGWFGDDWDIWRFTASPESIGAPRWAASFNHLTAPEIVAGLTAALARDYAESDTHEDDARFLERPSMYWRSALQPLLDAGWRQGGAEPGVVKIIAPDGQAGARLDRRYISGNEKTVTLWSGPPGWGTRAEAVFTAGTPSHLIAATAAAMTITAPVVRERHMLNDDLKHLVTITPVTPRTPRPHAAPTPLDVRRTAVTEAVKRAARTPRSAADLRATAARSRTAGTPRTRPHTPVPTAAAPPASPPTARHPR